MKANIFISLIALIVTTEILTKSNKIAEIVNDTEYPLVILNYKIPSEITIISSTSKNFANLDFPVLHEGNEIYLEPFSRTLITGLKIPFRYNSLVQSTLLIALLTKDYEEILPLISFWQDSNIVYGDYVFSNGIRSLFTIPVLGGHTFSFFIQQHNDDVLFRSEKNQKLYFLADGIRQGISISMIVNSNLADELALRKNNLDVDIDEDW